MEVFHDAIFPCGITDFLQVKENCCGVLFMNKSLTYEPKGLVGFDLINALFPVKDRTFLACISSRIATLIQVGLYDLRNHG